MNACAWRSRNQFAEVLLAEDKGWPASQVKDLWDNSVNSPVTLDHKIPVHMTYFTAVVDETGKVSTFADLYGLDNKIATALFGNAAGFPMPPPEPRSRKGRRRSASPRRRGGPRAAATISPAPWAASSGIEISAPEFSALVVVRFFVVRLW